MSSSVNALSPQNRDRPQSWRPGPAVPTGPDTALYTLSLACPDKPGIVHAVLGALVAADCNISESHQYGSPDTGIFFMRVAVTTSVGYERLDTEVAAIADSYAMQWGLYPDGQPVRTLIMASKDGHCLNDLLFQQRSGLLPVEIPAIVSNHPDLRELAEFYGVAFHHIPRTPDNQAGAEAALRQLVADHDVELVVLARYMQILSDELCRDLSGRAINIHHSFLPSFKGARPYAQAHARGVKLIGATAHYVTDDLDEGPIIEQEVVRVEHSKTAEQLARLGRDVEGRTLAQAVQWHAEHRVLLDGRRTIVFK